ncbi:preprotein translocase subunit SecG [Dyadobacter chenwenxiniae]|uniref:Protein-export membrane protein SecG n=1 Tax=Dyadobacter chenwenxiniae TaxID=2906456 RepID=A0A9X1PTV6_9BACT|nr:preprotein translocase subunit SecG [Dyadobacter chenwenxiniae]MCF0064986.1 preprotein translocase subunit SecG [Dyadobacter chenwenxiniae]UON83106.1 preprotein translocase subunit SecG [Dyadobacter chenwenxiniae]
MYLGLIILVAIIAVLLILVVLVQNSKGGGLSSEFSGAGTTQMFGVKKTTDLLEQITWGLAGAVILISLASYIIVGGSAQTGGINSVNVDKAQNTVIPGGNIAPAPGAAAPGAAAPGAATAPTEGAATTPSATPAAPADSLK